MTQRLYYGRLHDYTHSEYSSCVHASQCCFTRVADGIELFEDFLKSEFSDENIQFWKACERFSTLPEDTLKKEAEAIFEEYIAPHAPKMVNC